MAASAAYRKIGKWALGAALAAALAGIGILLLRARSAVPDVPTAQAILGEFVDHLELRGQVKALKSAVITGPFSAGDLQIVRISRNGELVQRGDVIVQFDTSTIARTLQQKRSDLKQADADIERTRAQARIQEEKTLTELTQARYDVERARLDAATDEILSAIEVEKNRLALDSAQRKLRAVEAKLESDRLVAAADIESKRQKREKTQFEVDQAERNLAALALKAPVSGMVNLLPNYRAAGIFGSSAPEFKAGDRAWPGAAIAELPDLSAIRVSALADEIDRSRLAVGQPAVVQVDAVPGLEHSGRIVNISTLTKLDYSGWPPKKNFEVTVSIENPDNRLRPGMSATARVEVESVPGSIMVPAEAVFQKAGRSVAYVLDRDRFQERSLRVGRRSGGRLLVSSGLKAGEKVALKDPSGNKERNWR
jgi:RND family efflux transporter MFP subunit